MEVIQRGTDLLDSKELEREVSDLDKVRVAGVAFGSVGVRGNAVHLVLVTRGLVRFLPCT